MENNKEYEFTREIKTDFITIALHPELYHFEYGSYKEKLGAGFIERGRDFPKIGVSHAQNIPRC